MIDNRGTALVPVKPAKRKEVTVKSNQLQKGTADEVVSKLLGIWQRRGVQRRIEDLHGEYQVERLRRHLLGLIARQDIEIEHDLLELKDRREFGRMSKQTVQEFQSYYEMLEGIEDVLKKSNLSDGELQATLRRAIRRIIQDLEGRGTDGRFD